MWNRRRLVLSILVALVVQTGAQTPEPTTPLPPGASQTPYNTTWSMEDPIESIQGTYDAVQMDIAENPPMLASVWEFGDEFDIVAWPPKFCHAIYVCFVPSSIREMGHFHIFPNMCDDQSIKWYPHIKEVQISTGNGAQVETMFNQMNSIRLRKTGVASGYNVEVTPKAVETHEEFQRKSINNIHINMTGMNALILTNSRFCFAHLSQAKRFNTYASILSPGKYDPAKISELPKVMTSYNDPQGHHSIFSPVVTNPATKSVDLVKHILSYSKINTTTMRQSPQCSSFRTKSTNSLKTAIGVVSADSWSAGFANVAVTKRNELFYIHVGKQCSWLRVWISSNPADNMDNYMSGGFNIEDTIDFFFDEQFMIPADTDEARPLFGNSTQIGRISIRRFPVVSGSGTAKIVEVAYGRDKGLGLPFIEYFHMPSYHGQGQGTAFKVTLIKAPNCEATILPGGQRIRYTSDTAGQTNPIDFQNCDQTLYRDPKEVAKQDKPSTA